MISDMVPIEPETVKDLSEPIIDEEETLKLNEMEIGLFKFFGYEDDEGDEQNDFLSEKLEGDSEGEGEERGDERISDEEKKKGEEGGYHIEYEDQDDDSNERDVGER